MRRRGREQTTTCAEFFFSERVRTDIRPRPITTGEAKFVECRMLCRVPKIGHSAKPLFAECCTRQRVALPCAAACPALGKARHSAKALFAERNTRQRAHSAKYPSVARLPRPHRYHLKKNVYRALNLTLGKKALCRVLRPGTRQRPSLPSVRHGTRQSIFVFFYFDFKFFL